MSPALDVTVEMLMVENQYSRKRFGVVLRDADGYWCYAFSVRVSDKGTEKWKKAMPK